MENRQVITSAGVVGSFTLLSRFLGLARDVLMAGAFGTTLPMSAFVVAFTVPNLFRRLFGEGALSAAFVPVFIDTREKEGREAAWRLARNILSLLTLFLGIVVILGIVGIALYQRVQAPSEYVGLILSLLQVMLPYTLFICLAALYMAILNAHHHFATPAFAPSLLNIVWVIAVAGLVPLVKGEGHTAIFVVAWAILFAGVLQAGVQWPKLMQYGYRPGWSVEVSQPKVKRVFHLMGPASLGMAITQINVVIDRLLAVWVGPWAPAALFFAERLIYFPQGIFATALATVLLPVFSGHAARAHHGRILETINFSLRNLLYVMIPASIGLLVFARPIVQLLFEWGAFEEASTQFTATALMFYAPGLLVFSLAKVFVPAFYALQDTKTPVKVGIAAVALKLTLSVLFVMTWPEHLKHGGLALATVLAEAMTGFTLAWLLHRRLGSPGWRAISLSAARSLVASVVMALGALQAHRLLVQWTVQWDMASKPGQLFSVIGAIGVAVLIYLLVTGLLGSPELRTVLRALRQKVRRAR